MGVRQEAEAELGAAPGDGYEAVAQSLMLGGSGSHWLRRSWRGCDWT